MNDSHHQDPFKTITFNPTNGSQHDGPAICSPISKLIDEFITWRFALHVTRPWEMTNIFPYQSRHFKVKMMFQTSCLVAFSCDMDLFLVFSGI